MASQGSARAFMAARGASPFGRPSNMENAHTTGDAPTTASAPSINPFSQPPKTAFTNPSANPFHSASFNPQETPTQQSANPFAQGVVQPSTFGAPSQAKPAAAQLIFGSSSQHASGPTEFSTHGQTAFAAFGNIVSNLSSGQTPSPNGFGLPSLKQSQPNIDIVAQSTVPTPSIFSSVAPTPSDRPQGALFGLSSQASQAQPFSIKPNPPSVLPAPQTPSSTISFGGTLVKTNPGIPAPSSVAPQNGVHLAQNISVGKQPDLGTSSLSSQKSVSVQTDYAKAIYDQLRKDNIKPPQWPAQPGNPSKHGAMESFRETYKKYRDRVRTSLIKAGLIDDPEVRKRLDEAIDFKGICEDMCPEFEKITRIVQYDVKNAEKVPGDDGTMWASTPIMVKALARSAAGQEAPLPMDVRSVGALRRSVDYLIDKVLKEDSRLPSTHNFLWDRTRAVRRDFVFHSKMSDDEMVDQVYCLENITRFHAVALHLLSQKGFAAEDFSEQQEREQLGKSLLSLTQAYDDCKIRKIPCANEAEFRAYFVLLNAHDSDAQQKIYEWDPKLWGESDEIQTAISLVQTMQSFSDWRGPVKPAMPTTAAVSAFTTFFRIVEDPKISYTMACFAEIHFTHIRRCILRNLSRAYSRSRDAPKDITVPVLNSMLRFDTEDEAVEFAKQHDFQFSDDDAATAHLLLDKQISVGNPTIRQSFSRQLVERKRSDRSLPDVIHTTVFEKTAAPVPSSQPTVEQAGGSELFVDQANLQPSLAGKSQQQERAKAPETEVLSNGVPASSATAMLPSPPVNHRPVAETGGLSLAKGPSAQSKKSDETVSWTPGPLLPQSTTSSIFAPGTPDTSKTREKGPSTFASSNKQTGTSEKSAPATAPAASSSVGSVLFPLSSSASTTKTTNKAETPSILFAPAVPHDPVPPQAQPRIGTPTVEAIKAPAAIFLQTQEPPSSQQTQQPAFSSGSQIQQPAATPQPLARAQKDIADVTGQPAPRSSGPFEQVATQVSTQTIPTTAHPPKKPDPMGNFTNWFVLGDGGLLDDFQSALAEHLLRDVFAQYQAEEEERKKREEDEQSWAEAMKWRKYNLGLKYFYYWRKAARELALNRRLAEGRKGWAAFTQTKQAEIRAAKKRAAEDEESRRSSVDVSFMDELRARKIRKLSNEGSESSLEAALLATGVLRGVPNERAAVARVVREAPSLVEARSVESTPSKTAPQERLASRNGLAKSLPNGKATLVSSSPEILASSTNSRYGAGRGTMNGRTSVTKSPASNRNSGGSMGALDMEFRYKRIMVNGRSKIVKVEPSRPPGKKITNFTRSVGTRSPEDKAQSKSNLKSVYWRMRANGMVRMPNGEYVHEALVQSLPGSRRHSVTSLLPAAGGEAAADGSGDAVTPDREEQSPLAKSRGTAQTPSITSTPPSSKRKRSPEDGNGPSSPVLGDDKESPSSSKKRKTVDIDEAYRTIQEMREVGQALVEDTDWFREQNQLLQKGVSPWDLH